MKSFFSNVLSTTIGVILAAFIAVIFLLALGAGMINVMQSGSSNEIENKSLLRLHLSGQLIERVRPLDFELFGEHSIFRDEHSVGLFEMTRALKLAQGDPRIVGVYLDFEDFDSGWAGVTALRREIEEFEKTGKPVYAYADRLDEKTYYLATAASEVWLQPNGEFELNGLAVSEAFFKGLFDKLEIEPRIFRVGKFKAAVEPFVRDSMSDENRRQTQDLADDIWKQFRQDVAHSRKLSEEKIDAITANLDVTSAKSAKDLGLVNDTIYEDEAEERMAQKTVGEDEEARFTSVAQLLHDRRSRKNMASAKKKIAVIFAEGEIGAGEGSGDSISSEELRDDIKDARNDEMVAAIVLRINSPGGDALASDIIWRELMMADEDVPVIVSMGDVAASGGYYIAAAGRYVFAEPTTITGSIGVFGLMFGTEKLFKNKAGVRFDHVVTHPHADLGDANRPISQFEGEKIQSDVNRVYERFIDAVQEGRGYEDRKDILEIAEGRVWSGRRAKELGLVDELGGLPQAIAKAAEYAEIKDFQIEIFPSDSDPVRHFIERFSGSGAESFFAKAGLTPWVKVLKDFGQKHSSLKPGIFARMSLDLAIH